MHLIKSTKNEESTAYIGKTIRKKRVERPLQTTRHTFASRKKGDLLFSIFVDLFNARKYYAHIIFIESCSNIEYNNLIENIWI